MEVTTEILEKYEGGHLRFQNGLGIYCGKIERAWVKEVWFKDRILHVKFKWLATKGMLGGKKWYANFKRDFSRNLNNLGFKEVNEGCLFYEHFLIDEFGTFFPPKL